MSSGGHNKRPLWDRFHEKFIVDAESGCWLWTAATCGRDRRGSIGAGVEKFEGKNTIYAHRAAWILYHGPIPEGMGVLHKCDVPQCVNPDHLFLGAQLANVRDCKQKGRLKPPAVKRGIDSTSSILSEDAVRDIRRREKLQKEYAKQYGVDRVTISNVQTGRSWGHVA